MKAALPYQAILFDLDGTLIDSSPSILKCFERVLHEAGIQPLVPLTDSLIGPPLRQTLINLTGLSDNTRLDQLAEDFKKHYDTEGYKATQLYDGINNMLEHLADNGIPLAIATNKRRIPTLKIIELFGFNNHFSLVGTLDTPTSPHADKAALIRFLLNSLNVDAASTLYVGDKWEDGLAADENNMHFCAATWGYGEWEKVKKPAGWQIAQSAHHFMRFFQG